MSQKCADHDEGFSSCEREAEVQDLEVEDLEVEDGGSDCDMMEMLKRADVDVIEARKNELADEQQFWQDLGNEIQRTTKQEQSIRDGDGLNPICPKSFFGGLPQRSACRVVIHQASSSLVGSGSGSRSCLPQRASLLLVDASRNKKLVLHLTTSRNLLSRAKCSKTNALPDPPVSTASFWQERLRGGINFSVC